MAKGPLITKEIEGIIAELYLTHPDWPATVIQGQLKKQLGNKAPGLSTVQKRLAKIRQRDKEMEAMEVVEEGLDAPWSPSTLGTYPIPADTLPMVLRVWQKRLAEQEEGWGWPFTIRNALWSSRLSKLFDDPEIIWSFASWYSIREKAFGLLRVDPWADDLDTQLLKRLGLLRPDANQIHPKKWKRPKRTKNAEVDKLFKEQLDEWMRKGTANPTKENWDQFKEWLTKSIITEYIDHGEKKKTNEGGTQ